MKFMAHEVIEQIAKVLLIQNKHLILENVLNVRNSIIISKHECYVASVDHLIKKCFSLKVYFFIIKSFK